MHSTLSRACLAAALLCAVAPAAFASSVPPTVTLGVEYRDFLYNGTPAGNYGGFAGVGHPDFQNGCCSGFSGMVGSTLGAGGVPSFIGSPGYGYVQDATSFAQWYRDVAGVNTRIDGTLTLNNIGGTTYQYSSNSFFPIDGKGFNSGGFQTDGGHNFSFTMHLGWSGTVTSLAQNFTFTGDDDVWVFANGKLFIDLGGVHASETASATGASILAAAGASLGDSLTFDLFFAERHTTQSNFTLTTDIVPSAVPEPTSLAVLGAGLLGLGGLLRRRATAA